MKTLEIIYDSLLFPLKHLKYLLLLGFLILLSLIITISPIVIAGPYYEINIISIIFLLFFSIIIFGFVIRIVHSTIHNEEITEFNWLFNMYEGIKFILLLFFYFVIPMIILTIFLFISQSFDPAQTFDATLTIGNTTTDLFFNFITYLDLVPDLFLGYLVMPVTETTWIGIILLLFSTLLFIGIGRYADEYNVIRGVDLGSIINIMSEMKAKYFLWFILTLIIGFLFVLLSSVIGFVIIGDIITLLIIQPFILMFIARSTGLIYIEIKKLKF